jgi:hypothetical protein
MELISDDPSVQAEYESALARGVSHKLAEMFALRTGPSLSTDTRWLTGHHSHRQFDSPTAQGLGSVALAEARRQGVSVEGAVYKPGLASYPGDPTAWVRDRGDVKRIAALKNLEIEGPGVTHHAVDDGTPDPLTLPYRVADDIVDREIGRIEDVHPNATKDDPELREKVSRRLSGEEQ